MFFESEDNTKVLASFLRTVGAWNDEDEASVARISISREIIGLIYNSPSEWDTRCPYNIKHVGDQFLNILRAFDENSNPREIDKIYVLSYRFVCEYDFLVGPGPKPDLEELLEIKYKVQNDASTMKGEIHAGIIWASYIMPSQIAKDFINEANIGAFKDFEQKKVEAQELKERWDKEIESKESAVEALKEKLEKYKVGFNFVGLYQGFSDLAEKKTKEASSLFWSLFWMGVLILSPLVLEIIFVLTGMFGDKSLGIDHLLVLVPIISIEIILIYFFRVVLLNHRSVKAQIMQIELRQTLCQFIQSYADYSSEIKKVDGTALEKFERLIFSGVISDPEKLPSTFDGIEQIGNLIKSLKNS